MKKILLLMLVISLSLSLGALTPALAEKIKQGGSMIVTYKDDVSTLDPAIGYDWQNWSMIKALFNGLMDLPSEVPVGFSVLFSFFGCDTTCQQAHVLL